MTTSQPSLAVEIYEEAKKKGIFSLDAPGTNNINNMIYSIWW